MMQKAKKFLSQFDFMSYRKPCMTLSMLLILVSLGSLAWQGLNWGLDFTGGTLVEVTYPQPVALNWVRQVLEGGDYDNAVVQYFGDSSTILIRLGEKFTAGLGTQVFEVLKQADDNVVLHRTEFIGAQVGEELQEKGGIGMLLALCMMLIYISFRFQLKFAGGALVALFHDVVLTLGIFSLFRLEFDLSVLAAILAVIGYSLNDTLVISDRIRENFRNLRIDDEMDIINTSLRQVFGRTLITSLTTLFVLVCLWLFGGEGLRNFSIALTLGVVIGTYSSIYISSALLLFLKIKRGDLVLDAKEGSLSN